MRVRILFVIGWLALSLVTLLAWAAIAGTSSASSTVDFDDAAPVLSPAAATATQFPVATATPTELIGAATQPIPGTATREPPSPSAGQTTTSTALPEPPTPSTSEAQLPSETPIVPAGLNIDVTWPETMPVNASRTVRLVVEPALDDEALLVVTSVTGEAGATSVEVPAPAEIIPRLSGSSYDLVALGASLQASSLAITPPDDEVVKLFRLDGLEWEWSVSGEQTGTHSLSLVLKGYWRSEVDEVDYDIWRATEEVRVADRFSVWELPILPIVTALFGNGLLTAGFAWLYTLRRDRRAEPLPAVPAKTPPPPPRRDQRGRR